MKKIINPAYLIMNAIGIFFYLKNASLSWAMPEEKGLDFAIGGVALVWGVGALPILLLFIVLSAIFWAISGKYNIARHPLFICMMCWALAVAIDFYNH